MSDQPRFPTYHGPPLPRALNPLNPRHYWLLFKWIFFQPSKLLHYLWQADKVLYQARGFAFLKIFRLSAYRQLYIIATILLFVLGASLAWFSSIIQGTPVDWPIVALGIVLGLAGGVGVGAAVGSVFSVAVGMVFGVVFGVASGVGISVWAGVSWGIVFIMAYSMAGGVALGIASSVTFGLLFGAGLGILGPMGSSMGIGTDFGIAWGVASGLASSLGGSRFIFYFLEFPLSWLHSRISANIENSSKHLKKHPVLWDELTIWPLIGAAPFLQMVLTTDYSSGVRQLMSVAANPFQRWSAQRALSDWFTQHATPLLALYNLCYLPDLDEYLFPPASNMQFMHKPSARIVLLSELGQQFIAATSNYDEVSERIVWLLTRRQRRMEPTPLSRFSWLLRDLFLDQKELETAPFEEFETLLAPKRFQAIANLPHGIEITASFTTIRHFLGYQTIADLSAAHDHLGSLEKLEQPLIRPPVIQALQALGDISQQTARFKQVTNLRQKTTALNLAAGQLNELETYVRQEVLPPERVLLIRIIQLWQDIVAAAQGAFAQSTLKHMSRAEQRETAVFEPSAAIWQRPTAPIDNPYVVGNPVAPPLFVGRSDIFNRISDVCTEKENPDSIILYGHRRMGKSSILRNLNQAAPSSSLIVYADMGGETSFVASTADLLLGLADKIYNAARRTFPEAHLSEPDPAHYTSAAKAGIQFNRLAEQVRDALGSQTLILALDEFEAIERAVADGKISGDIFQFLRTTAQEKWLTLVFGGLHTLDEMSRDYRQPFYNSYVNILVSYLTREAAKRLITDPSPDFNLNYEHEAVEQIITVSGGQPSLVQQLCRDALDHLNHELFDLNLKRDVLIKLSDVEAVLNREFFQRGAVYFDGVWNQTENDAQRMLLVKLAQQDEPWSLDALASATELDSHALQQALRWAERHDILHKLSEHPPTWKFCVPLMRRWLKQRS